MYCSSHTLPKPKNYEEGATYYVCIDDVIQPFIYQGEWMYDDSGDVRYRITSKAFGYEYFYRGLLFETFAECKFTEIERRRRALNVIIEQVDPNG